MQLGSLPMQFGFLLVKDLLRHNFVICHDSGGYAHIVCHCFACNTI